MYCNVFLKSQLINYQFTNISIPSQSEQIEIYIEC